MYPKQKDTKRTGLKMATEFSTSGFENLFAAMQALEDDIGKGKTDKIWRNALAYAMEPVLQDAKSYAPKDTGQTAERIYMRVHRPQGRDKSSNRYAGENFIARVTASTLRDDSVQNFVVNKRGRLQAVWSNKSRAPVSQEFGNARTPTHPFMLPALNNNEDKIKSRLGSALWEAIQKVAKGEK
jgi:HK97 gp10 family phage protein